MKERQATASSARATTELAGENMNSGSEESGQKLEQLRERLTTAMESAKAAAQRLEEKTIAAAKATDQCIRDHPYQTLGIAFGLGLLFGVLVARRRD